MKDYNLLADIFPATPRRRRRRTPTAKCDGCSMRRVLEPFDYPDGGYAYLCRECREEYSWVWRDASEGIQIDAGGLWEHAPCGERYVERPDGHQCPAEGLPSV